MSTPGRTKTVYRLGDAGYRVVLANDEYTDIIRYHIIPAEDFGDAKIVELSFDTRKGMVTVHEAWNKDCDPIKNLKLRDMIVSAWVYVANQSVTDLRIIKYEMVCNDAAREPLFNVYKALNTGLDCVSHGQAFINDVEKDEYLREKKTVVVSNTCSPVNTVHKRCLWNLSRVPFTKGVKSMCEEYEELKGRSIESFLVTEHTKDKHSCANFYIKIGDRSPSQEDHAGEPAELQAHKQLLVIQKTVQEKLLTLRTIRKYMKDNDQFHLGAAEDRLSRDSARGLKLSAESNRVLEVYEWVQRSGQKYDLTRSPSAQPRVRQVIEILQILNQMIYQEHAGNMAEDLLKGKDHLSAFFDSVRNMGSNKMSDVDPKSPGKLKYESIAWPEWPTPHFGRGKALFECKCLQSGTPCSELSATMFAYCTEDQPFDSGLKMFQEIEEHPT